VTGPHVGFAAGVAATAYAAKKYPEMEPDWDYHFGKNILYAFGTKPDILAVGAAFGVLGMLIARIFGGFGVPIDGIAFSVVATAFLARLVFGYPLVGSPAGNGYFDMTPYERDERRDDGSDRPAVEPWLPQQYEWSGVAAIGLVGGVLGGWTWMITGSVFFMAYGISAASLLFLNLGVANFPVTHHITLGGSTFAVIAGAYAVSEPTLMVVAALGGLVGRSWANSPNGSRTPTPGRTSTRRRCLSRYTRWSSASSSCWASCRTRGIWASGRGLPTPVLPAKRPSYRSTQLVDGHLPNESMDIKSRISRRRRGDAPFDPRLRGPLAGDPRRRTSRPGAVPRTPPRPPGPGLRGRPAG